MKIKIIKTAVNEGKINESKKILAVADGYYTFYTLGYKLGKELGRGDFGIVHSVTSNKNREEYALKVVSKRSKGFMRERNNYENIMDFVKQRELNRKSPIVTLISDYLPKIYSVEEHPQDGDLYIIMEKLVPLSEKESKEWMAGSSGLAYFQRKKQNQIPRPGEPVINYAQHLYDRVIDTQGSDLVFDEDKARELVDLISKSPEHQQVRKNKQKYENHIIKGSDDDSNYKKYVNFIRAFSKKEQASGFPAAIAPKILDNIDILWQEGPEARRTINAVIDVIVAAYKDGQVTDISTDPELMTYLFDALFDVLFAQKNPMQYKKRGTRNALYQGYGQTDDIFKIDWEKEGIKPNPIDHKYIPKNPRQKQPSPPPSGMKFTQDKKGRNIIPGDLSSKKFWDEFENTPLGQKYRFNPIMNAVQELAEDWDIEVVDLHNANVMKRTNGQIVFVDVGLFETKARQPKPKAPVPPPPMPSASPSGGSWESGRGLPKKGGSDQSWGSGKGLWESKNRLIKIKIT